MVKLHIHSIHYIRVFFCLSSRVCLVTANCAYKVRWFSELGEHRGKGPGRKTRLKHSPPRSVPPPFMSACKSSILSLLLDCGPPEGGAVWGLIHHRDTDRPGPSNYTLKCSQLSKYLSNNLVGGIVQGDKWLSVEQRKEEGRRKGMNECREKGKEGGRR